MSRRVPIRVTVNGKPYERDVEPRMLLSDFLRYELGLTGTHVGCEHGVCGACTVLLNDDAVRSCLLFAVQTDGHELITIEGLAPPGEEMVIEKAGVRGGGTRAGVRADEVRLHPLQEAFWETHGLQCGFCTPGILLSLVPFLEQNPQPNEEEIREALSGNLCRCTGYQNIVEAVKLAARKLAAAP